MIYYHLGESNVQADVLSSIPWDQNIRTEAVKVIFKATVEGPNALIELYACHKKAIRSLILESTPAQMTAADWVHAQKADPTINQVVNWMESKKVDTVKAGDGMSQEQKQYLRQWGEAVFVRRGSVLAW